MKPTTNKRIVIFGLLLGILLSAMDNTIVSTAMATIVSEIGGLDYFTWVTSAYMIASVAGMPLYGRLSDMYGRKRFFLAGLTLFMVGSVLCGLSQNVFQLSIFRAIQGLGGGAIIPIAFTIIFDIVPPQERGKMSGLFGAVFGLSSVLGPFFGAYLTDFLNWRWVFYINIPLGLVSLFILLKYYKESSEHSKHAVDWSGAILLFLSVSTLMFALELGGRAFPWISVPMLGLAILFISSVVLLIRVEKIAAAPILSLDLFKNRLFSASQIVCFLYGAVFILPITFIPLFMQGVHASTATGAGMVLSPMMIGTVIGSQIGGQVATKVPYRNVMLVSCVIYLVGIFLTGSISPETSSLTIALFMLLSGIGMGVCFSVLNMASIHGIPYHQRGQATSSAVFFRSMGMTIGIALFGALQNALMRSGIANAFVGAAQQPDIKLLLDVSARGSLPSQTLTTMTGILAHSVTGMFHWALPVLLVSFVLIFRMGTAGISDLFQTAPSKTEEVHEHVG